jgi:hypothetical protein
MPTIQTATCQAARPAIFLDHTISASFTTSFSRDSTLKPLYFARTYASRRSPVSPLFRARSDWLQVEVVWPHVDRRAGLDRIKPRKIIDQVPYHQIPFVMVDARCSAEHASPEEALDGQSPVSFGLRQVFPFSCQIVEIGKQADDACIGKDCCKLPQARGDPLRRGRSPRPAPAWPRSSARGTRLPGPRSLRRPPRSTAWSRECASRTSRPSAGRRSRRARA